MDSELSIEQLRAAIDDADEILLRALGARFKAVSLLHAAKKKEGLPSEDKEREAFVKNQWKKRARELDVSPELALLMLDFILAESKRRQQA